MVKRVFIGFQHAGLCRLAFISSAVLSFSLTAFATSGITYHGRLLKPDDTPVNSTSVQFRLQIRTPGTEDCLLYEETQTHDLSTTNGMFAISIGDGAGTRQDSNAWSLFDAFSNRKAFSFAAADCLGGITYTPSPTDNREFKVSFNDGSFVGWEDFSVQVINFIPMSVETYAVGGYPASSLLKVETAGVPGTAAPLTSAQFTEILALIGGTSTQYSSPNELNGSTLPTIGTGQSVRWTGSAWEAYTPPTNASLPTCTAGQFLTSNGTALSCVAGGSGSVSDGDDITSGTIGGTTAWNTSGNITTTGTVTAANVSSTTASTQNLRIFEATNTNHVSIVAPTTFTNYVLTLPVDDGDSGEVLSTDGNGVLSWTTISTPDEVILDGGNTTGATVIVGTNDAQSLQLETNNSPRMTILSGGNVGIGTDNPGEMLHIQSNQANSVNFKIRNTNTGTAAETNLVLANNTGDMGYVWTASSGNTNNTFARNRMMVESASGADGLALVAAAVTGNITFHTAGNFAAHEKMRISTSGNVGIGTDNPGRLLHVNGPMRLTASTLPATVATGDIAIDSGDSNKLKWYDGSDWQDAGGGSGDFLANGSVDMTGAFHAADGSEAAPSISFANDTNTGFYRGTADRFYMSVGGNSVLQFSNYGIDIYRQMTASNGSVTEPNYSFSGDSNTGFYHPTADTIGFATGGAEQMRIIASGDVGIGTNNPSEKLHVDGNVLASAYLYTSDRRLKKNIEEIAGLQAILALKGVKFDWVKSGKPEIGLIAQDVEKVLPELVVTDPKSGIKAVKYGNLVAPLIQSTKELYSICESSRAEIASLKLEVGAKDRQLKELEERLSRLENMVERLSQK